MATTGVVNPGVTPPPRIAALPNPTAELGGATWAVGAACPVGAAGPVGATVGETPEPAGCAAGATEADATDGAPSVIALVSETTTAIGSAARRQWCSRLWAQPRPRMEG